MHRPKVLDLGLRGHVGQIAQVGDGQPFEFENVDGVRPPAVLSILVAMHQDPGDEDTTDLELTGPANRPALAFDRLKVVVAWRVVADRDHLCFELGWGQPDAGVVGVGNDRG